MGDDQLTRRKALQSILVGGVGLGGVAIGCGGAAESPAPPAHDGSEPLPQPSPSSPPEDPPAKPPEEPKLTPKELLAGIDHIVVLMMENRSFDHYLGSLKSDPAYAASAQVEGLSGTEANEAPDGSMVKVFKMDNFTPEDPPHEWDEAHAQWGGGKNDGFVKEHAGASQNEAMGYHDRSQLPLYYWFADNFAICDHWFSSVLGPTWPNRLYLHATTSKGKKDNTPFASGAPETVWDALKAKNLAYKNYAGGGLAWYYGPFALSLLSHNPVVPIADFFKAAQDGKLPPFSIVDPDFFANDDHPSHNIQRGQAFVASVYKALAESPLWLKTLLIVTYDENGGFFDHVAPPAVVDDDPEFAQLGFRVPAFVIGATVKKGYVCKTVLEHSSVAATLRTRWDIKSLSKRMDGASDISDCIDPKKVTKPVVPPLGMPQVAMTLEAALHDGVGPSSQPMLEELAAQGKIPVVDARSDEERIASWLSHAKRLGAVRIIGP